MKSVWVLDDEPGMRWVLERALDKAGWAVRCFADGPAMLTALDYLDGPQDPDSPAVLLFDARMPEVNGFSLLSQVRIRLPDLPVIMMTAYTDPDASAAVFSPETFGYLAKPFDIQAAIDLIARAADTPLDVLPPGDWRTALAEEVRLRLHRQNSDLMDVLRQDFERVLLRQALTQADGQRGRAALMLGIGRNTLARKCRELGLDSLQEKQPGV